MGESQGRELAVLYAGLLFYFRGYHGVITGSDSQLKHRKMSAEVKVGVFCFLGVLVSSVAEASYEDVLLGGNSNGN